MSACPRRTRIARRLRDNNGGGRDECPARTRWWTGRVAPPPAFGWTRELRLAGPVLLGAGRGMSGPARTQTRRHDLPFFDGKTVIRAFSTPTAVIFAFSITTAVIFAFSIAPSDRPGSPSLFTQPGARLAAPHEKGRRARLRRGTEPERSSLSRVAAMGVCRGPAGCPPGRKSARQESPPGWLPARQDVRQAGSPSGRKSVRQRRPAPGPGSVQTARGWRRRSGCRAGSRSLRHRHWPWPASPAHFRFPPGSG